MTHKARNIKHNPNVTVLIDNQAPPWKGVLIYGEAELDYEDVVAKRISIFERYMPAENARKLATGLANSYAPVVIRVKPKRMTSYDYSKPALFRQALPAQSKAHFRPPNTACTRLALRAFMLRIYAPKPI